MAQPKQDGKAIMLHDRDNVGTALEDLPAGSVITWSGGRYSVTLVNDIRFGHKFALNDAREGELIYKYGVPIGKLIRPVRAGEHVHLHNLVTMQKKGDFQ